jgi:hypothetical protein
LRNAQDDQNILDSGFRPPNSLANTLLGLAARCEPIPQQLTGSSVMMIAINAKGAVTGSKTGEV